jgi:peroxiredoxin (alkyl hydroperoxide reductase subunit C)
MSWKKRAGSHLGITVLVLAVFGGTALAQSDNLRKNIYPVGKLKPRDSVPKLQAGQRAPDFTLPEISGRSISLSDYRGRKHVVISFVPAAWTPVCTYQWPVYHLAQDIFDSHDAVLLGITVDNVPTLYAWTNQMVEEGTRLWFPVLSDFYPHGQVAAQYGVLRSEGVSERALFVIDREGIIRHIEVYDINERPPLRGLISALKKLES